jgi:hypothetical protein
VRSALARSARSNSTSTLVFYASICYFEVGLTLRRQRFRRIRLLFRSCVISPAKMMQARQTLVSLLSLIALSRAQQCNNVQGVMFQGFDYQYLLVGSAGACCTACTSSNYCGPSHCRSYQINSLTCVALQRATRTLLVGVG